ncbi:hypothetical protein TNCV_2143561 [Trichonephila clavipes]|nr:hypothetical protein TNCV_2143561 [Trichonephila clavipes]
MPPNTLRVHTEHVLAKSVGPKVLWAEITSEGGLENVSLPFSSMPKSWRWRLVVAFSIVKFYRPFGNFSKINRTVTCMVLKAKANDMGTSNHLSR